jgi:O-antigen ligase
MVNDNQPSAIPTLFLGIFIDAVLTTAASWLTILLPVMLAAGHVAADIGLCLIGVLFLVHSWLTRDWRWCRNSWIVLFVILWLYMIVRGFFAEQPKEALKHALPFVRYAIFAAALAYWTLRNPITRQRFFSALAIVMVFFAADGLLQWITGSDIFRRQGVTISNIVFRLTGPYSKPILGIMLAWLFFPVCMQFVVNAQGKVRQRWELVGGILAIILINMVVVLSGERVASMLMVLGWLIMVFLLPLRKRYVFTVGAVILLVCASLLATNSKLYERHVNSTIEVLSRWRQSPYGVLLASDLRIIGENPVFGVGTGHFRIVCPQLFPERTPKEQADCMSHLQLQNFYFECLSACSTHPHNIYLEWLIENGVIGLGLFLLMLAAVAKECVRCWPERKHDPFFAGLMVGAILHLWPLAPSTSFLSAWASPSFWLVFGAMLAYTATGQIPPKIGDDLHDN